MIDLISKIFLRKKDNNPKHNSSVEKNINLPDNNLSNKSGNTIIISLFEELKNSNIRNIEYKEDPILSQDIKITVEKIKLLKEAGFTQTAEYLKGLEVIKNYKKVEKLRDTHILLMNRYPLSLILSIDNFNKICKKYGLVYANTQFYKKEVPIKNLLEIQYAKPLHIDDRPSDLIKLKMNYNNSVPRAVKNWFDDRIFLSRELPSELDDYTLREFCPIKFNARWLYKTNGLTLIRMSRQGFFIAAPKTHFDLTTLLNNNSNCFEYNEVKYEQLNKDPIVFRFINGNYVQILTKWGEESEDVNLTNPISN